jgi:hypothetical protein
VRGSDVPDAEILICGISSPGGQSLASDELLSANAY